MPIANAKSHKARAVHATSRLWQGRFPQGLTERITYEQRWSAECSHRANDGDRRRRKRRRRRRQRRQGPNDTIAKWFFSAGAESSHRASDDN